ncbi:LysR family transcriptional regulator [Tropicibacter sp. R16_0]|uniref:LysR family transcriptional regulator n=1 Tax=Tropicibacter sp. R16_0 TaxID=2821102 RepID=UPI002570C0BD|nr:LysR family transcriptional regulator [Tropicibacter sp. R16_0]
MFSSTKLRQIVAVDRAGSMSAASQQLNVSQSTLTKAVADVELDLGLSLFHRTAKGVIATPEGREFLDRAERIVADFDLLVEDTKAQKKEADQFLRIGFSPAWQEGLYNRAVAHVLKANSDLSMTVSGPEVDRGVRMLKRGDLDLLFAPLEVLKHETDFAVEHLGDVHTLLYCRKGHPLLAEQKIDAEMLSHHRIIIPDYYRVHVQKLTALMNETGTDPRRKLLVIDSFAVARETVLQTDLIGVVSQSYATSRRFREKFGVLNHEELDPLHMGVARMSRWHPSRAMRACLAAAKRFPIDQRADAS